eukprot:6517722-Pyramimonas_sp.AAC.1
MSSRTRMTWRRSKSRAASSTSYSARFVLMRFEVPHAVAEVRSAAERPAASLQSAPSKSPLS